MSMGAPNTYDNSGGYGNNGRNSSYDNYGGNYGNQDAVVLRVSGRDRQIPVQDVAVIDFAGNGNISQNERNRATQSYDGLVVLRNGRMLTGRVVDFQSYNNQVVVADQNGEQNIPISQVARVYFGNNTAQSGYSQYDPNYGGYNQPGQYGQYGQYGAPGPYDQNGQYGRYGNGNVRTVTVPTNEAWSNSGIDVRRGQVIHFRASGNVSLSQNQGDYGTPAGANDGRKAGNSPLPRMTGGMLIGRVGNSRPFPIGAESDVTMPADGRLYFGVNDDYVGDNSGDFIVEVSQ